MREGSRQISRRAAATVSPPSGQSALTFGSQLSGHGEGSDQKGVQGWHTFAPMLSLCPCTNRVLHMAGILLIDRVPQVLLLTA